MPTSLHVKKMLLKFAQNRHVAIIGDLHGHSRRLNSFIYACEGHFEDFMPSRVFSLMMS